MTERNNLNPIFVIGQGRSGTSILLRSLFQHPDIIGVPGESPFIRRVGDLVFEFETFGKNHYYTHAMKIPIPILYDRFRELCVDSTLGLDFDYSKLQNKNSAEIKQDKKSSTSGFNIFNFKKFCSRKAKMKVFQSNIPKDNSKIYWTAKTFPSYNCYLGLCALYPDSKYIYITRNAHDQIYSATQFPDHSGKPFKFYCEQWKNHIIQFKYVFENSHNMIHIKYEDLKNDSESTFKKLFDFLDIEYNDVPFQFSQNNLIHPLNTEGLMTNVDVKKILSERKPSYSDWSDDEKALFKETCSNGIKQLNYDISF